MYNPGVKPFNQLATSQMRGVAIFFYKITTLGKRFYIVVEQIS